MGCVKAWEDPAYCKQELGLDAPLGTLDPAKLNIDGGLALFAQKRNAAIGYLSQGGRSYTVHPATFEPVPDPAAQVPQWAYDQPRAADWPQAEFIVGNPPFIGAATMRRALGDGYVDAVRGTWKAVPGA